MLRIKQFAWVVLLSLLFAGCAVRSPYEEASDPLEPVNRVIYKFNDHASVGLELSNWHTEYQGASDGNDVRVQTAFIYKF